MKNSPQQPRCPAEWKQYANSEALAGIPLKQSHPDDHAVIVTYRDVYLDGTALLQKGIKRLYVYVDVLGVLTADAPALLKINPPPSGQFAISIYAPVVDQPISVCSSSSSSSAPIPLSLGPETENAGASVVVQADGSITVEPLKAYPSISHADFTASLQTQLRIAQVLFWRQTALAMAICAHVAALIANERGFALIDAQAAALGRQLAAQTMTGPDTSWAPVLILETYLDTLKMMLESVQVFEDEYERFQDKEQALKDQLAAWDAMLKQAADQRAATVGQRNTADAKYKSAKKTVESCKELLKKDGDEMAETKKAFQEGIEQWKHDQQLQAVFRILGAIFKAGEAVKVVEEAETIAGQIHKLLSSDTLAKLKDCMAALGAIFPAIDVLVNAVEALEDDPTVDIPTADSISGSRKGDADSAAIVTLAAWDKWILESDDQLEFAVSQGIDGASDYRLALRKHAINGKALAQAQAEAVKTGEQFVQLATEVILCDQDIQHIKDLQSKYKGEDAIYEAAETRFYDRFMAAYRYYALEDSDVVLDSLKTAAELRSDIVAIKQEIDDADSRYSTDSQPFNHTIQSSELPLNYHEILLSGLKSSSHSATFTLAPDPPSFASVFKDGYHYRLDGLEVTLTGAMTKPSKLQQDGSVEVMLQITTSGAYSDISEDHKTFQFASLPQQKRFGYELLKDGSQGEVTVHAIFETKEHAEPTPFTHWTIKLLTPEKVNLDKLTSLQLRWAGHCRYREARRRGRASQR
ncbi:hypothetical protein F4779DRAFT_642606 [Xylariaceae sp. FL0662B]|nr:hypothetical protein F4779DRAFT_642606 [Xylariaceae sp. FL0662B]